MNPELKSRITSFAPHKGGKGAICIFGGSFEYSGAPYFSAISGLRTGADLAFVITDICAASVIKSYSPELIVHGVLDRTNATGVFKRTTVAVVGPGLSRNENIYAQVFGVLSDERLHNIPLIIDGDGIGLYIAFEKELQAMYKTIIITPNVNEFEQLKRSNVFSSSVIIYYKGVEDYIIKGTEKLYQMAAPGCPRRCGGLGDVLVGVIAALISMSGISSDIKESEIYECLLIAGSLVRCASAKAFLKQSRAMSALDVIGFLKEAFDCELSEFYFQ